MCTRFFSKFDKPARRRLVLNQTRIYATETHFECRKSFVIEYDNTQNKANHIHTVWREFGGDFGRDLLREHLERDHKH